ncbi:glycerol-3-phosphate 1-O-acyltransferase PlsB [Alteromonadaceae bacterium BrNp21-10]|nr:glycerol-3-phosphate 1-O-acyltransferase PlsB [Alteromonadaceae bacterium BrNp21-10]
MNWAQKLLWDVIAFPAKWFISTKVIPREAITELAIDPSKPIIYLLKTRSVTDLISLRNAAALFNLPDPEQPLHIGEQEFPRSVFLEKAPKVLNKQSAVTDIESTFTTLFEQHHLDQQLDIQIIPVALFWGRAPGNKKATWRDLLAHRASPNWLRKIFIVLFLGRHSLVYFSPAVSSRHMANEHGSDQQIAHKLIRVARTHFQRRRQSVAGPRQMAREQIISSVIATNSVQAAIQNEQQSKKISSEQARKQAYTYASEIAGDYREGLIRLAEQLLAKLWNKVYRGLEIHHADRVRELAQAGHEIIYVPCHRSHMDYLLLTYVIYHEGLMVPHIAAGINLNFWPAGPIFRRAGAFFIRRSFAGNKLYTAVFKEYLQQLFNRGYSVKYYPEGGRSRTGRLLPPKTGMLAMTIQSMFKGIKRPISLVPVYIGYEHVMEVSSYLKELQGKDKKKESFLQVFSAIRKLKNYGTGYLSFGEPINLGQFMESSRPNWQADIQADPDKKPNWLTPMVNDLANDVMCKINQAAAVNGMNLTVMCLLAAEKNALSDTELTHSIEHILGIFSQAPFSHLYNQPQVSAPTLLEQTLSLNKFNVSEDNFGRVISLDEKSAIVMTYYRNNVLHVMALPCLIAAIILAENGLSKTQLLRKLSNLFPIIKHELFIYLDAKQTEAMLDTMLSAMINIGLIVEKSKKLHPAARESNAYFTLMLLSNTIQETLQRYAIVLTQLNNHPQLSRSELEKQSIKTAERLTAIHGINAPEFYDKNVIASLIAAMRELGLIKVEKDGSLAQSPNSQLLLEELYNWLTPAVTQSIKTC